MNDLHLKFIALDFFFGALWFLLREKCVSITLILSSMFLKHNKYMREEGCGIAVPWNDCRPSSFHQFPCMNSYLPTYYIIII